MFFKKDKKKNELLKKENIILNAKEVNKADVIKKAGELLVGSGYVEQEYIEGMLLREESFPTYIGNGIAIPHGVNEVKKYILKSGLVVMTYPQGILWGNEKVRLVIGIAGFEGEHLKILGHIAESLMTQEAVDVLVDNYSVDEIYEMFTNI
ncbi:MAG: PTS sugar transporter subunit IIA [Eubacteriaceae bacterium]